SYLNKVKQATANNPEQQVLIRKLEGEIELFHQYMDDKIAIRQQNLPVPTDDIMEGKARVQTITETFSQILEVERNFLDERSGTAQTYATSSLILIIGAALTAVIVSLYFFSRILQDFSERSRLTKQLREK